MYIYIYIHMYIYIYIYIYIYLCVCVCVSHNPSICHCCKTRPGIHSKQNKHSGRTHGSIPHGADEHNARASRTQSFCWNTVAGSRLQATVRNSSKRAAASANAASAQALTTTRCHRANADTPVRSGTTPTWVSTHSPRPPTGLHWIQGHPQQ